MGEARTKGGLIAWSTVLMGALTLVSGVVQGRLSNRWGTPVDIGAIAEAIKTTPEEFGKWRLRSSETMDADVMATLECKGYFVREYVNRETGRSVRVALLLGPSGPISVHTPEVCFSSRDFEIEEPRRAVTIGGAGGLGDTLWAVTFRSNDALRGAEMLRVYYGWSTGGPWMATEQPRLAFAGRPYLYKLQLAGRLPAQADLKTEDACREFLEDFLPVARSHLVAYSDD